MALTKSQVMKANGVLLGLGMVMYGATNYASYGSNSVAISFLAAGTVVSFGSASLILGCDSGDEVAPNTCASVGAKVDRVMSSVCAKISASLIAVMGVWLAALGASNYAQNGESSSSIAFLSVGISLSVMGALAVCLSLAEKTVIDTDTSLSLTSHV